MSNTQNIKRSRKGEHSITNALVTSKIVKPKKVRPNQQTSRIIVRDLTPKRVCVFFSFFFNSKFLTSNLFLDGDDFPIISESKKKFTAPNKFKIGNNTIPSSRGIKKFTVNLNSKLNINLEEIKAKVIETIAKRALSKLEEDSKKTNVLTVNINTHQKASEEETTKSSDSKIPKSASLIKSSFVIGLPLKIGNQLKKYEQLFGNEESILIQQYCSTLQVLPNSTNQQLIAAPTSESILNPIQLPQEPNLINLINQGHINVTQKLATDLQNQLPDNTIENQANTNAQNAEEVKTTNIPNDPPAILPVVTPSPVKTLSNYDSSQPSRYQGQNLSAFNKISQENSSFGTNVGLIGTFYNQNNKNQTKLSEQTNIFTTLQTIVDSFPNVPHTNKVQDSSQTNDKIIYSTGIIAQPLPHKFSPNRTYESNNQESSQLPSFNTLISSQNQTDDYVGLFNYSQQHYTPSEFDESSNYPFIISNDTN